MFPASPTERSVCLKYFTVLAVFLLFTSTTRLFAAPPTVTSVTPIKQTVTDAEEAVWEVNWDQSVVDFDDLFDVTLVFDATVGFADLEIRPILSTRYHVAVTGLAGTGNLSFVIPPGIARNLSGELNVGTFTNVPPITIVEGDTTAPFLSSSSSLVGNSISSGEDAVFQLNFSEEITGFDNGDVVVNSGALGFSDVQVTSTRADVYTVRIVGMTGDGFVSLGTRPNAYTDLSGNPNTVADSTVTIQVQSAEPSDTFTLGVLTFATKPGGSIVPTGNGNDRNLTGPIAINGFLTAQGTLQVRGNTVTGDGRLEFDALGGTDVEGDYIIDANSGRLTQPENFSNSFILENVSLGLCEAFIGSNSLNNVRFYSLLGEFENTAFDGFTISADGADGGRFYTTSNRCNPPSNSNLRFDIGSVELSDGLIRMTSFSSRSSARISNIDLRNNTTSIAGTSSVALIQFSFDNATFFPTSIQASDATATLDGALVTLNEITIPGFGGPSISGGEIFAGGMTSTFESPRVSFSSIFIDEVTMQPGGGVAPAVADGFSISRFGQNRISSRSGTLSLRGVRFPFNDATIDGTTGFVADRASLTNVDILSFRFSDVVVNSSGLNFSGAGFDLVGLKFSLSIATPETGAEGLVFSGSLALPDNLTGASLGASVSVVGNTAALEGLQFCTPSFGIEVKKSNFDLPQLCFEFSKGPPEVLDADASIAIPGVFTVEAGFTILNRLLDRVTIAVEQEPGIAIGNTGAFLQRMAATVRNISRQLRFYEVTQRQFVNGEEPREVTRRVLGVPPVQFVGEVGVTAGPSVLGQALVRADASVLFDETQINVNGAVTVVIFEVGGAYVHVVWSGPQRGSAFGGFMIYAGVLRGEVNALVGFDGRFFVGASLHLEVPNEIPIIGGLRLGSVDLSVSAPPFEVRGNVSVTIIPGGCFIVCWDPVQISVGFSIDADGSFSVGRKARGERFADWEIPYFKTVPVKTAPNSQQRKSGKDTVGELVFFTNFYQTDKVFSDESSDFRTGRGGDTAIIRTITTDQPVIIRLAYEDPDGIPDFNITTPTGNTYTPLNTIGSVPALANPADTPLEAAYRATPQSRNAAYFVATPPAGDYTITILQPDTLGSFAVEVLTQNAPPTFEFTDAVFDQGAVFFDWIDEDIDDDANIDIYLDNDRRDGNGVLVLSGISEDDDQDFAMLDLLQMPLAAGWYYPVATIDDSENAPVVVYSETPIFVPDVEAPPAVMNINAVTGNGFVIVSWDPVDDPEVVSYKVLWTKDAESGLFITGAAVDAGETVAVIEGLSDSIRYKFTVVPVRYTEDAPMTAAKRVEMWNLLSDTAKSLRGRSYTNGNNRHAAKNAAANVLSSKSKDLDLAPARFDSLAQQAAQLSTNLSRRQIKSADKNPRLAKARRMRSDELKTYLQKTSGKGVAAIEPYVDGFQMQFDVIVPASGENNPPIVLNKPVTDVLAGEPYLWQLKASDAEGDSFTFELVDGPSGLTVSPSGFVEWFTGPDEAELYSTTVRVTDDRGASSEFFWRFNISNLRLGAELLFVSVPNTDIIPGETWTYTPIVRGLFDDAEVTFELLDGPDGIIIDSETGVMSWETNDASIGSHRVIVQVTQTLFNKVITDQQELQINVEDIEDTLLNLEELDLTTPMWLVF